MYMVNVYGFHESLSEHIYWVSNLGAIDGPVLKDRRVCRSLFGPPCLPGGRSSYSVGPQFPV